MSKRLTKKELAKERFAANIGAFCCPLCGGEFVTTDTGVRCRRNHNFDLARQGYLSLFTGRQTSHYDQTLFLARREVFSAGVYAPLIDEISSLINALGIHGPLVLDAGCGEGSFLAGICSRVQPGGMIGVDISRAGIRLATSHSESIMWCVADLAELPFGSESVDVILNVLSPANYGEFKRVLKPGGVIIKVLPREGYLREIRQRLEGAAPYSNEDVLAKFEENLQVVQSTNLKYQVNVNSLLWQSMTKMTPLSRRHQISGPHPKQITIDLEIIQGSRA